MCLNGSFKMTAFRNRLLGLAAGTLALGSFSSMAYAQGPEEVLNFTGSTFGGLEYPAVTYSTFTFNQLLILNSIGFVYDPIMDPFIRPDTFGYEIVLPGASSGVNFQLAIPTYLSTGIAYFDIPNPTTYAIGTQVFVISQVESTTLARSGFTPYAVGVTHSNPAGSTFASGNLRVTALGGSVAPEPGSFALAMTGGAALLGICMRRRRNAAWLASMCTGRQKRLSVQNLFCHRKNGLFTGADQSNKR
jgi:hypothetical protein